MTAETVLGRRSSSGCRCGEVNQTWSFWGLYPSMILMQDGRLFYSGSHVFGNGTARHRARRSTTTPPTRSPTIPGLQNKDERDQSASVLLPPAQDQRVLTLGGGNIDSNPDAQPADRRHRPEGGQPGVRRRARRCRRARSTSATAGRRRPATRARCTSPPYCCPTARCWRPAAHCTTGPTRSSRRRSTTRRPTRSTRVATDPQARGYHSSAFLLPDGRVMSTGDNPGNGTCEPQRVDLHPAVPAQGRPPDDHVGDRRRVGVRRHAAHHGRPARSSRRS